MVDSACVQAAIQIVSTNTCVKTILNQLHHQLQVPNVVQTSLVYSMVDVPLRSLVLICSVHVVQPVYRNLMDIIVCLHQLQLHQVPNVVKNSHVDSLLVDVPLRFLVRTCIVHVVQPVCFLVDVVFNVYVTRLLMTMAMTNLITVVLNIFLALKTNPSY